MKTINGYAHVWHKGRLYYVSPSRQVIYLQVNPGIDGYLRDIDWDGPTGRLLRAKAGETKA